MLTNMTTSIVVPLDQRGVMRQRSAGMVALNPAAGMRPQARLIFFRETTGPVATPAKTRTLPVSAAAERM
jgi:hypothetical protein